MKQFVVTQHDAPRLERFLAQALPNVASGVLHKYLRQNKIKVNGKKCPLSTRLTVGDTICVYLPPAADSPAQDSLVVLYEDAGLLAVDKPAGLPVMEEGSNPRTLLAQATRYLAQIDPAATPALCHRLDTGTSGVVLIAKTLPVLEFVTGLIRAHQLRKKYLCVTFGHPQPAAATLGGWMAKNPHTATVRMAKQSAPGAKPVETQYRTRATSGRLALVDIQLITGRTHQIRVHMASIGTPVLGDAKYGDNVANRQLRCRYQCLCSKEITFPADVPAEFAAYANLRIACGNPWYVAQILDGTLC